VALSRHMQLRFASPRHGARKKEKEAHQRFARAVRPAHAGHEQRPHAPPQQLPPPHTPPRCCCCCCCCCASLPRLSGRRAPRQRAACGARVERLEQPKQHPGSS
jgi:hypothetical protein